MLARDEFIGRIAAAAAGWFKAHKRRPFGRWDKSAATSAALSRAAKIAIALPALFDQDEMRCLVSDGRAVDFAGNSFEGGCAFPNCECDNKV